MEVPASGIIDTNETMTVHQDPIVMAMLFLGTLAFVALGLWLALDPATFGHRAKSPIVG